MNGGNYSHVCKAERLLEEAKRELNACKDSGGQSSALPVTAIAHTNRACNAAAVAKTILRERLTAEDAKDAKSKSKSIPLRSSASSAVEEKERASGHEGRRGGSREGHASRSPASGACFVMTSKSVYKAQGFIEEAKLCLRLAATALRRCQDMQIFEGDEAEVLTARIHDLEQGELSIQSLFHALPIVANKAEDGS